MGTSSFFVAYMADGRPTRFIIVIFQGSITNKLCGGTCLLNFLLFIPLRSAAGI